MIDGWLRLRPLIWALNTHVTKRSLGLDQSTRGNTGGIQRDMYFRDTIPGGERTLHEGT